MLKFPAPFPNALFVCTNVRPEGHPKPCCGRTGGPELRQRLKELVEERGLVGRVMVFQSGCLGACERGPIALQYPSGELMLGVGEEDLAGILDGIAGRADG